MERKTDSMVGDFGSETTQLYTESQRNRTENTHSPLINRQNQTAVVRHSQDSGVPCHLQLLVLFSDANVLVQIGFRGIVMKGEYSRRFRIVIISCAEVCRC